MHISTRKTFMIDAIETKGFCPVCCKENQPIKIGWVEEKCEGCGSYFSMEGLNRIVEKRRKLIGLTRKKMGEKFGLSRRTVANYENVWPSKKYWIRTQALMKSL